MNKVYLDNAATTQIREEVIREMVEVMSNDFGGRLHWLWHTKIAALFNLWRVY